MIARLVLGLVVFVGGTAVPAQSPRTSTAQFASCMVKRDAKAALQFVETPVDSARYATLMRRILEQDCYNDGLAVDIPPVALRGSLFEALYKHDFAGAAPDLRGAAKVDYLAGYAVPMTDAAATAVALAHVGDCVVRADPAAARQLLSMAPDTPPEQAAIGVVAARLPACLDKGQTIPFSRSTIRALVAEALYRLTAAAVAPGAVK